MPNLYGVANAPGYVQLANTIGAANINCPAGAYTSVVTSPAFTAPSNGYFYAICWMTLTVVTGVTPPGGMAIGLIIGAGSLGPVTGPSGSTLPASSTIYLPGYGVTSISQSAWLGLGSSVTIQINPTGQAVTVNNGGTWAMFALFRAPDQ